MADGSTYERGGPKVLSTSVTSIQINLGRSVAWPEPPTAHRPPVSHPHPVAEASSWPHVSHGAGVRGGGVMQTLPWPSCLNGCGRERWVRRNGVLVT
jgi:hypothetical protein